MAAAARRSTLKVPIRLTLITLANAAKLCGADLPSTRSASPMPAQIMAPCSPPKASIVAFTALWTLASSVTSVCTKRVRPPSSAARPSPLARFTSAMATLPPALASMRTQAAPSPELPPLTRKVWSLMSMADPSNTFHDRGRRHAMTDAHDLQAELAADRIEAGQHLRQEY